MLEALQSSWLARAIGESQMLTASLSAMHLIGFTLVMGSGKNVIAYWTNQFN